MPKNGSLIAEIKVQLEWCLIDAVKKYPHFVIADVIEAFELFYQRRDSLIQEGWLIIDDCMKEVLQKR